MTGVKLALRRLEGSTSLMETPIDWQAERARMRARGKAACRDRG